MSTKCDGLQYCILIEIPNYLVDTNSNWESTSSLVLKNPQEVSIYRSHNLVILLHNKIKCTATCVCVCSYF